MTADTLTTAADRIAEHARTHRLPALRVIFHGGEPLLAGAEFIEHAATTIRAATAPETDVDFRLTTNGVLLNEELLALLRQHRIQVGVSVDGGRAAHDRERRFANGRGSYQQVARGLRMLAEDRNRAIYAGLLCTVDIRNDPLEVYEGLLAFSPPEVELLLPHGNWSARPRSRTDDIHSTPYADWLIAIFDRWFSAPRRETRVRIFESIIMLLLGGQSRTEAVGLSPVDLLTVETDGTLEQSDSLKTTGEGMAATGMDVWRHSFDDALPHPGLAARRGGLAALAEQCRRCPVVTTCGGGLYAHRFRAGTGFANPSVYCPDLFRLIDHIRRRVGEELRQRRGTPGNAIPHPPGPSAYQVAR
jgi:uncharacterized protein